MIRFPLTNITHFYADIKNINDQYAVEKRNINPTKAPSDAPSLEPSASPSEQPTWSPSYEPSMFGVFTLTVLHGHDYTNIYMHKC